MSSSALNHTGHGQCRITHTGIHTIIEAQLMPNDLLRHSGFGAFA